MIGMHVTDVWKLADYHNIIKFTTKANKRPITIQQFAGILGRQLITISSSCSKSISFHSNEAEKKKYIVPASLVSNSFSLNVSSISVYCADASPTILIPIRSLADCQGVMHHQVKLPMHMGKNGKKYNQQQPCKQCKGKGIRRDTTFYCYTCGLYK
jgi:hypothetical protein